MGMVSIFLLIKEIISQAKAAKIVNRKSEKGKILLNFIIKMVNKLLIKQIHFQL